MGNLAPSLSADRGWRALSSGRWRTHSILSLAYIVVHARGSGSRRVHSPARVAAQFGLEVGNGGVVDQVVPLDILSSSVVDLGDMQRVHVALMPVTTKTERKKTRNMVVRVH